MAWPPNTHQDVEDEISVLRGAATVIHGSDADFARPATSLPVIWFGTVAPNNADDTLDVYVPVTSA